MAAALREAARGAAARAAVESQGVEGEVIECEVIESEAIESEAVEGEVIEGGGVEGGGVEGVVRRVRSAAPAARAEHFLESIRRRDLELIVAAGLRRLVRPPAQKDRRVAEAVALQMVVLHFADPLDPDGLP